MANLMRCKACGFVTDQGNIKDVCPACGVPAKMFEPYTNPVSLKRRKILDLHTHPVLVHFPQAFALTLVSPVLLRFFCSAGSAGNAWIRTIKVLSVLLPFFVDSGNSYRSYGRQIKISKSHNTAAEKENPPEPGLFYHRRRFSCPCFIRRILNVSHPYYFYFVDPDHLTVRRPAGAHWR
ncbi:MAG: hypothetical protein MZV70_14775 [Desulfobacterales bacterium]|nr:hypothetical protein [Desulfobacterales bacterium]